MQDPNSPDWKIVETIAAQLEKALTPVATVEHNVWLPVLGTERKRQCDIVIKYGDPPRQSLTIVEVQKRKRKPDINTFHGWIEKMRSVGAQHLICVSALGYPKSIIEDVITKYGPTVRLLTLKQLEEPRLAHLIFPFNSALYKKPSYVIESIGPIKFEHSPEQPPLEGTINIRRDAKVFGWDDESKRLTLDEVIIPMVKEIARQTAEEGIYDPDEFTVDLRIGAGEGKLWYYHGGQRLLIKDLLTRITVSTEYSEIPVTFYSYEQQFIDGSLAWVVAAKGFFKDKEVSFRMVFKPNEDGLLELSSIQQEGVESIAFYSFKTEEEVMAAVEYHRSKIEDASSEGKS